MIILLFSFHNNTITDAGGPREDTTLLVQYNSLNIQIHSGDFVARIFCMLVLAELMGISPKFRHTISSLFRHTPVLSKRWRNYGGLWRNYLGVIRHNSIIPAKISSESLHNLATCPIIFQALPLSDTF